MCFGAGAHIGRRVALTRALCLLAAPRCWSEAATTLRHRATRTSRSSCGGSKATAVRLDPTVETELLWTLSFLGAALPESPNPLTWRGNVVTLRLDHAGIEADALPHWERLFASMKASEEYRVIGTLDIGRFRCHDVVQPEPLLRVDGRRQAL